MSQEVKTSVSESIMAELVTRKQISPGNIILVENFTLVHSSGHKIADLILLIPMERLQGLLIENKQ